MPEEDTVRAAEAHLNGITAKDVTAVPYHPDVIIETPLGPPIKGADAARQAVASVFPAVKEIRIVRHIADGDWCATLFDFEYVFGTFRIIDIFHVVDGRIISIQAYYDPRPILQGLQQFMSSR
jgi:hypothetical protein